MRRYQNGMSLTELLIALLLSNFIMMGLMHHYLYTKKQYDYVQKEIELNTDLQLVTDLIRNSIRQAGFTPCLSIGHLVVFDQRDKPSKLAAIEFGLKGEASLKISRMNEYFDTVLKIISPIQLLTTKIQHLHQGQSIMIADCYHAEVQTIATVHYAANGQLITLLKPTAYVYQDPVYLGEWVEEIYFIRAGQNGKKSLFYQYHHAEELTTAVQALSVNLKNDQGRAILQLVLGVDQGRDLNLETMVRA